MHAHLLVVPLTPDPDQRTSSHRTHDHQPVPAVVEDADLIALLFEKELPGFPQTQVESSALHQLLGALGFLWKGKEGECDRLMILVAMLLDHSPFGYADGERLLPVGCVPAFKQPLIGWGASSFSLWDCIHAPLDMREATIHHAMDAGVLGL